MKVTEKIEGGRRSPLVLPLSLVAGLGLVLMITALVLGVVQGESADSDTVGMLFGGGLVLFILGAASWFVIAQPQRHFDDINIPAPDEHHDEHALAVSEGHPVSVYDQHTESTQH